MKLPATHSCIYAIFCGSNKMVLPLPPNERPSMLCMWCKRTSGSIAFKKRHCQPARESQLYCTGKCLALRTCLRCYLEVPCFLNLLWPMHISKSHSIMNQKEWQLLTQTRAYIRSTVYRLVLLQLRRCFSASWKSYFKGCCLYTFTLTTFWSPQRPLKNNFNISKQYLLASKSMVFG